MMIKELMARLSELNPEDDVYILDGEYGPELANQVREEIVNVLTANGRMLPKNVWVIQ